MARSNFQFTGAPKTAQYRPKGLDFFMAAPMLRAEVKGEAMALNQRTDTNTLGIHSSDMELAKGMTEHLTKAKDKNVDVILGDEPISDEMVQGMVKNFNSAKDAQEKFMEMRVNAQRIEKNKQFIEQQKLTSKDPEHVNYLDAVWNNTMDKWGGTYAGGEKNEFTLDEAPSYVDIKGNLRRSLSTAAAEMSDVDKAALASINQNNIKIIPKKNADGSITRMLTYDKQNISTSNRAAIDGVLDRLNEQIADETTNEGQYLGYIPEDQAESIIKSLPAIVEDHFRTGMRASDKVIQHIGTSEPPVAPGSQYVQVKKAGADSTTYFPDINMTKSPTFTPSAFDGSKFVTNHNKGMWATGKEEITEGFTYDYKGFNEQTKEPMNIMYGSTSPNVTDVAEAIGVVQGRNSDNSVYRSNPGFMGYLNQNKGRNGQIRDIHNQVMELKELGIEDLNITQEDFENQSNGIYDKKVAINEKMAEQYADFVETKPTVMRGYNLDYNDVTMNTKTGKTSSVNREQEFKDSLKAPDREVAVFNIEGGDNNSLTGMSTVDPYLKQAFNDNVDKGTLVMIDQVEPSMFGDSAPTNAAERAEFAEKWGNGAISMEVPIYDDDKNVTGKTMYLMPYKGNDIIDRPSDTILPGFVNTPKGRVPTTMRVGPTLNNLEEGEQVYFGDVNNGYNVKKQGDTWVVQAVIAGQPRGATRKRNKTVVQDIILNKQ